MKKLIIIMLTLICFTGCSNKSNSIESQFINDFEKAILNRLDMSDDDATNQEIINSEYSILSKYENTEFTDKQLDEICKLYLLGLNTQKEAIDSRLEYNEYDIKWQEGLVKRYQAIEKIYNNYDIFENDKQIIENRYINQLKMQTERFEAFVEISDDLESQIENANLNYNGYAIELPITNNTKYTYDITLYFTFYDSNGNRIAYEAPYFADIKPKIKNKFEIYVTLPESASNGTWDCKWTINNFI